MEENKKHLEAEEVNEIHTNESQYKEEIIYDEDSEYIKEFEKEKTIYDETASEEVVGPNSVPLNTAKQIDEPKQEPVREIPREEDAVDRIRTDKNDVTRTGFDARDLPHYCCPVCNSQRKNISALTHKKRFKKDEETVAFITLCQNCGHIDFYGIDIPNFIEYLQVKQKSRKRGR